MQKHPEYDGTAKKRFFLLEEAHTLEHMVCVSHLPECAARSANVNESRLNATLMYEFGAKVNK